ncbi:transcriptional regulatory protein QseF [bacterium BMS3Abin07]|nr:transcriptional regulatory protein QseF [bacterium BMS3Abin07]GBE31993.1 transcriptional regulatory protein QseF [bacterium BMS3Bbin05]HDO22526.1 sigma-54-dependent Fis family transcriptional regulator [Nitrospirota bacterium]HDZ87972.1 sigma-54-dependent Fis family transcriptional regulator [Nitrospirota bacterium]
MKESILLVDDNIDMLNLLERVIRQKLDVEVKEVCTGSNALGLLAGNGIDVVVADINMPEMDGMTLLKKTREFNSETVFIILTAFGTVEMAVEALKIGAYDFLTKPINNERFIHTIKKAIELRRVIKEKKLLEDKLRQSRPVCSIIGNSNVIKRLLDRIRTIAETDETVLISGETGTGKELAARTIHSLGKRFNKKFVAVNCPAIPESILESELFGYKKGAFTSAVSDKKGLFESADGGTIFLDEIGDIPRSTQTKLLRVLQEREFKPLGDTDNVKVNVRVIASTNQNLEKKIEEGSFREDLYYRLNVINVNMPSLREREEDILLLAEYFLIEYSVEFKKNIEGFSDDALSYLTRRTWHGNVRELQNVIKRAVIFEKGKIITRATLDSPIRTDNINKIIPGDLFLLDYKTARHMAIENFTVNYVKNLLGETDGNVTRAAKKAGIIRQSLQQIMKKYKINPREYKNDF